MVRTPVLPVERCPAFRPASPAGTARQVLAEVAYDPVVRQAVAVASPSLDAAIESYLAGNLRSADLPRVGGALLRYLLRMSSRSTPFGLFAAVGVAGWGPRTELEVSSTTSRRHSRPDMAWLLNMVRSAERTPEILAHLRIQANPCLLDTGARFVLGRLNTGNTTDPGVSVSVRATRLARAALEVTARPVRYADVFDHICQLSGDDGPRVHALLAEMCEQTILLTSLRPPLTCANPAGHVLTELPEVSSALPLRAALSAAVSACATWDAAPLSAGKPAFSPLADLISNGRVQVDALLELRGGSITNRVATDAARAAELLLRIGPSPNAMATLSRYRQDFLARYGPEVEVPVLQLLNPDTGLGSPYGRPRSRSTPEWPTKRNRTLLELASLGLANAGQVELDDAMLAALTTQADDIINVPRSLDLSAMVAAASVDALDRGDYLIAVGPNVGANAAGRNLARFAEALGEPGLTALHNAASREESIAPDVCLAELGYLPSNPRTANVILHPLSRRFELVLDWVECDSSRLIPPSELVVGVRDDRFYLRWLRTGQQVEVTVGHMVNLARAPTLPRFLSDVCRERTCQLFGFDWGPAARFPRLPRVTRDRLVLSLARWQLNATDWPRDPTRFASRLADWRIRWNAPRLISLTAGDNRIPLDLDDQDQADQLRRALAQSRADLVVLTEQFPLPQHSWLTGPNGRYLAEFVVPLIRCKPERQRPINRKALVPLAPPERGAAADGFEPPGGDWLFLKLYSPADQQDSLLTGLVADLIGTAKLDQLIDGWFFVRYADPDPHLRVRLHGQPAKLTGRLLPEVISQLHRASRAGLLARVTIDTYEREITRYGGPAGILIAEQLFDIDSDLVLDLLRLIARPPDAAANPPVVDRLQVSILSLATLLTGLGLTVPQTHEVIASQVPQPMPGGREYRATSRALRTLFTAQHNHELRADIAAPLERYRSLLNPLGVQVVALQKAGKLSQPLPVLYRTYAHMHINRLFHAGNRRTEMLALGLAARTIRGLIHYPADRLSEQTGL
jgi:lantibiotic biosynthesis protein